MVKKSVLVIGLGGREHALGWKLKQSKHVGKIYFAPGNAGTSQIGENVAIEVTDVGKLVSFAQKKHIDLTVVGPELSLAVGVVDAFEKEKLVIFGPSKKAAELETDKAFAADFVEKHKIPHPKSFVFTNVSKAKTFFKTNNPSDFVIKAAGLALGKGVVLPATFAEAEKALEDIMVNMQFGDAGKTIVVQERITGPEVSLLALSDGKTIVPMLPARDYKRVYDNGDGPNTGGMGAYAPAPFVDEQLLEKLHQKILIPTINGMKKNGRTYKGVLYVGLMLTRKGPMVIEYNNRFGDPETQPLMLLLDEDLFEVLSDCAHGTLSTKFLRFKNGAAVSVVLTSNGYPGKYKKGEIISGLEHVYNSNIVTFHAGTAEKNNKIISNGGRVLNITAFAKTQEQAAKLAYSVIGSQRIHFANMHYRHDIAYEKKYTINTKRYKAALFDFDGTLVDTEPLQYKSFALTLKEFGHTIVSKK
jgi:phosphoribosylamine--glycine ligase